LLTSASSGWIISGGNVTKSSGAVGIGTTTIRSTYSLDVAGSVVNSGVYASTGSTAGFSAYDQSAAGYATLSRAATITSLSDSVIGNVINYDTSANVGIAASPQASTRLYVLPTAAATYGVYVAANATTSLYSTNSATTGSGVRGVSTTAGGSGVYAQNTSSGYGVFCAASQCGGSVAWTNASDQRMKDHVLSLEDKDGLAAIMRLRPVQYQWRDQQLNKDRGKQLGFIAQEVEVIFPELVITSGDSKTITLADGSKQVIDKPKSMDYSGMVVPLVKAVQEIKAVLDDVLAKIAKLFDMLGELEEKITRALAENQQLKQENKQLRDRLDTIERHLNLLPAPAH
jgi:hypothetical protein